ncbi:hypothetical protein [Rhizobium leguminosarum]|uniref:hypothetical protein n=1 Tax=Rhizobium leguminosarum TaxID=384 RepID=UPI0024B35349|nr:hypothetical protein [Rhizobium leguminosarum]WHO82586.1 hypothetical protein QMO81_005455 [Rhizobium leguminosarum]
MFIVAMSALTATAHAQDAEMARIFANGGSPKGCRALAYIIWFNFGRFPDRFDKDFQSTYWTKTNQERKMGCNQTFAQYYGARGTQQQANGSAGPNGDGQRRDTRPGVSVDPEWFVEAKNKLTKPEDLVSAPAAMDNYAPYGDSGCVTIKPAPERGKIDWDWVKVRNKCSYPIKVLTCYYDRGEEERCSPGGNRGWGLSDTIQPGEETTGVATAKRWPWKVSVFVCNMTPLKHNYMYCVPPERYRRR